VVVPYNVVPDVGGDVAAVLVEPVAANMGLVPPVDGFLAGLRAACDAAGALLIFDEVITGFRVGRGGAQERFGITPDLTCLGKVIGGGLPLAAFGGRADVMACLAPEGPVYQAGTLSGNPLATAAGLAGLDLLDDAAYVQLTGRAAELAAGLSSVIAEAGLPVSVPVVGPLLGLFFNPSPPVDFATSKASDAGLYAAFFHAMLDRGVALPPSPFEALFPSLAHDKHELERTVDLAAAAASASAAAATRGSTNGPRI
jgi:glutamate-1-semialdehyde 2,1-aminomutase